MNDLMKRMFLGNSIMTWIISLGIVVVGFLLIRIIKSSLLNKLKQWSAKTKITFDDFLVDAFEKTALPFLYLFIFYLGLTYLAIPERGMKIIHVAAMVVTTFFVLRFIASTLQYFVLNLLRKQDDGDVKLKQANGIIIIVKIIVWALGIVFLLDNLGYNVTTIIAGLGIGGIAIALAAQAILGDLFSYFVILFDKPFEIGDFIIVDNNSGVIETIGIKTTRLRTLGGEQLICSNKYLTDSRIHNFKRMQKRRVVFNIGVTYQTSVEMLQLIPVLVKEIIQRQSNLLFDRGHFSGLGDSSLNFEFVYYILSSDYNIYMDKQQQIYFEILDTFEKRGIDFAYPTHSVILEGAHSGVLSTKE